MEKKKVRIEVSTEDICNGLLQIIDINVKNRRDFTRLLGDLIADNDRASEHFMKMIAGAKYPTLPNVGDQGYIKISDHTYTFPGNTRSALEESMNNEHGFLKCTVYQVAPIHLYTPLVITIPDPEGDGVITANIRIDQFYPGESVDIYDDLPI